MTARHYNTAGIPQIVIADKTGVIRWIGLGWDSTTRRERQPNRHGDPRHHETLTHDKAKRVDPLVALHEDG